MEIEDALKTLYSKLVLGDDFKLELEPDPVLTL